MVVLPIDQARADSWRAAHAPTSVRVVGDPDLAIFRALGAGRPSGAWVLRPRPLWTAFVELLRGNLPRREHRTDDTSILGVDLVTDAAGGIVLLHRARSASDRVTVDRLLAALSAAEHDLAVDDGDRNGQVGEVVAGDLDRVLGEPGEVRPVPDRDPA